MLMFLIKKDDDIKHQCGFLKLIIIIYVEIFKKFIGANWRLLGLY